MTNHRATRLSGLCLLLGLALGAASAGEAKKDWKPLFDGKSLAGWKETNFGGEGEVHVEKGAIVMERGTDMTGITYAKGDFPKIDYEVTLEGKKLKGIDFFCTTTFPVGDTHCSLVVGGWAGSVVGLSTIDGEDASRNATKTLHDFKQDQWYHVRIRVTKERIAAWIDDKQVVDLATKGKKISVRAECDLCKPFGIATWNTVGAVRDIRVRALTAAEQKEPEKKRKAKFTISKETTYVLGPVDKDGYIDYVAALNDRLGKGVTPKNNAVVLLMKTFGPRPEGFPLPGEFWRLLGIDAPPDPGDYWRSGTRYMTEELKLAPALIHEQWDLLTERPWTAKEYPHFAAWLKVNERSIGQVIESTKRERYYHPLVPSTSDDGIIGSLIPAVQKCRELCSALVMRAMLRTGERKYDEAWHDLLACHRLGRVVAKGGTLIESLVGVAIEQIASNADVAFLHAAPYDAKRWTACLRDLQALPPMPTIADKVDTTERFTNLQTILKLAQHGPKYVEGLSGMKGAPELTKPDTRTQRFLDSIDWDPVLRNANHWFDRINAAMSNKDQAKRAAQLQELEVELKVLRQKTVDSASGLKALLGLENSTVQAKRIGDILIILLIPAFNKVQQASDRIEQVQQNTYIAFALAAYKADHKRYPLKLHALTPKYLPQIPLDLFTGKALIYRPSDTGYLLYSFGPNGQDDQGRWFDDDPPGDDPRVRLPLPRRK